MRYLFIFLLITFWRFDAKTQNNDDFVNALELPDIVNYCSMDGEFTTAIATPDGIQPTNWNNGPNYNVWFKFQAVSNEVSIQVKTYGTEGTLRYPQVALHDSEGQDIASATYTDPNTDIGLSYNQLEVGEWYYISVDGHPVSTYRGSFTLCVNNEVSHDYMSRAKELPDIVNYCSMDGEFTTAIATPDGIQPTNWNNGPNYNVWFKFQAVSNEVSIQVKTYGTEGTLRYPQVALHDSEGQDIASATYTDPNTDIGLSYNQLEVGEWYYISVDGHPVSTYRGSFTLCVNNEVSHDYMSRAKELPDIVNYCSMDGEFTTAIATPDGIQPTNWNNGPNYNVWFKFQAVSNEVSIQVKTYGTEGTLKYPQVALHDSAGQDIASATYTDPNTDIGLSYNQLEVGEWYYISVDGHPVSTYRGSFTLCVNNEVSHDYMSRAKELPDIVNYCSMDGEFTTAIATPDGIQPTNWNNGPNYNVWFKFQAVSNEVSIQVKTYGTEGTLRYPQVALHDSAGQDIASVPYLGQYTDIGLSYNQLEVGEWYYISVDGHPVSTYRGSFTLCVDNEVSHDYMSRAKELPDIVNYCSMEGEFTTAIATPDGIQPTNWNNGPNYNVWFKFQAVSNEVSIQVKTYGTEGTLRYPQVALHDSEGQDIASVPYLGQYTDIGLSYNQLEVGEWYYISVDGHPVSTYRGSFTLCVDNEVSHDYMSRAKELPDIVNYCSMDGEFTTAIATPDGIQPTNWNNGPNYNVWFKFQAVSNEVSIQVKTYGTEGTLRYPQVALHDSAGQDIASVPYLGQYTDIGLSYNQLEVGEWYYISVDGHPVSTYRGSFTLCVDNEVSHDYMSRAKELPDIVNYCSMDGEFTTAIATPDGIQPTNWNNGPNYNVWFKFQAVSNEVSIQVKTYGTEGTLRYPQVALHDSEGQDIASVPYLGQYTDIGLSYNQLEVGEWYYISVDGHPVSTYRGSFTLCVDNEVSHDYMSRAKELPDIVNYCSMDGEFTTVIATPDGIQPTNWNNGPNYNVWFKFQAVSNEVSIQVKTYGTEGTLRYPQVALHDSEGQDIASVPYLGQYTDIGLSYNQLEVGEWYYISVDGHPVSTYRGSFTLCVNNEVSHDYMSRAKELPDIVNYCSMDGEFTTVIATPDGIQPTNWNNGPNYNVWFKFQAVSNEVSIQVKTYGTEGTLRYPQVALHDSAGQDIASVPYLGQYTDIGLSYNQLEVGEWYYISVDGHQGSNYRGSFTLCVTSINPIIKLYAINSGNWNDPNNWSYQINGIPANVVPNKTNTVIIDGYSITINLDSECQKLILSNENPGSLVDIANGTLEVNENIIIENINPTNSDFRIQVRNMGGIKVVGSQIEQ